MSKYKIDDPGCCCLSLALVFGRASLWGLMFHTVLTQGQFR